MQAYPRFLCRFSRLLSHRRPFVACADLVYAGWPADITGTAQGGGYRKDLAVTFHKALGSPVFLAQRTFDCTLNISTQRFGFGKEARRSFGSKVTTTDGLATEGERMIMQSVRIKCRGNIAVCFLPLHHIPPSKTLLLQGFLCSEFGLRDEVSLVFLAPDFPRSRKATASL